MKKLRFKLVKWCLNDSEKYLIAIAMEARMDALERLKVNDKFCDAQNISQDIREVNELLSIFRTEWRK